LNRIPDNTEGNGGGPRRESAAPGAAGARRGKRGAVVWLLVAAAVAVVSLGIYLGSRGSKADRDITDALTYTVRRGDLTVSVLEGGVIKALESLEIKSEVEGQTRILSIVPEGTYITEKDVEEGKILVELDSSELEEKRSQQEISFQSAKASYTNARESFEIQKQQNDSNIALAKLDVKFARMDLEHYLGKELAEALIEKAQEGGEVDFEQLCGSDELRGAARQEKSKLENSVTLAREELSRAEDKLGWTQKLAEKQYVSAEELEADKLAVARRRRELQLAEAALELLLKYELPKKAEQLYSNYEEAKRELLRVEAKARSQIAQAEAELKSKEAAYKLQKERLERLVRGIENCVIRATKPGLVVYASTLDPRRFQNNPIQEGFVVRERQSMITMPNMSTLAVEVNIHETDIGKVRVGQPARITVEALPGKTFRGRVARISVMANSEHRWLNPDIMVYSTDVAIEDIPPDLKPGGSATAEIIVEELKNVLFVPIQAVTTSAGQKVCWVVGASGPELRRVEIGHFTDKYVEIKSGLKEGDKVLLSPPEGATTAIVPQVEGAEGAGRTEQPPGGERTGGEGEPKAEEERRTAGEGQAALGGTEQLQRMRERLEKMTPEEQRQYMERMREEFEKMSPEERQKMMQQRGAVRGGRPGPVPPEGN